MKPAHDCLLVLRSISAYTYAGFKGYKKTPPEDLPPSYLRTTEMLGEGLWQEGNKGSCASLVHGRGCAKCCADDGCSAASSKRRS